MQIELYLERQKIAQIGALMFARKLTDINGGNISVRVGDKVCMTPKGAGQEFRWQLDPEQVLILDMQGNKLEGVGEVSRESPAHLTLLNEFPVGTAVVHAHAQNVLVFCAARQPIPPVLEGTLRLGTIPLCEYAPGGSHSQQLAENIAAKMRGQEEKIEELAAAVLAPWHGLFVLGKTLDIALDVAERIEWNAYCILHAQALKANAGLMDEEVELIRKTASSYE